MTIGASQIAFANNAFDGSLTYVDLVGVTGWTTKRGRNYELSRTETGTASITIVDASGRYDPTALVGSYLGELTPMKPARIRAVNPVTSAVTDIFTGFVESWEYEIEKSESVIAVTVNLVDGFGYLANAEVPVDGSGIGSSVGDGVTYTYQTVQDRIKNLAADAGWPAALTDIFTGNVAVIAWTYDAGQDILSAIHDASDAEFPGVANVYIDRDGVLTFHGRFARFNPTDPTYGINAWACGDRGAVVGHSGVARIAGLKWAVDDTNLINACLAMPVGIHAPDVPGQLAADAPSLALYGTRAESFEGLLTAGGLAGTPPATANEETKLYAQYYVDNYSSPRTRITSLTFQAQDPNDSNNHATWALMCGVEIGDTITVTTTHPGSGGFRGDTYFVESIQNHVSLGNEHFPQWTMTLDVSPQQWFGSFPS